MTIRAIDALFLLQPYQHAIIAMEKKLWLSRKKTKTSTLKKNPRNAQFATGVDLSFEHQSEAKHKF